MEKKLIFHEKKKAFNQNCMVFVKGVKNISHLLKQ